MTGTRLILATLAVVGAAAVGCGDDDDATTSAGEEEEATTVEEQSEGTTSLPSRFDVTTPPGDELVFEPDTATTEAGDLTVVWDNESKVLHSFCLEDANGNDVKPGCSTPLKSSNSTGVYPNLKPGKYTYYCDVDAHRAQGMEGTLTVE